MSGKCREPILISQTVLEEYDRTIKDQKAEIERLTDTLNATINGQETLQRYVTTAKAETIREFAERLKKHSYFDHKDQRKVVAEVIIDHYLKEMVGGE